MLSDKISTLYMTQMIEEQRKAFGNNLRKLREGHGYSQMEFANICDISRAYYGRIERGEHSATIDVCVKISEAMGVHISELFIDLP